MGPVVKELEREDRSDDNVNHPAYDKICRYYDILYSKSDDLPMYLELAKISGSPILELGVGTARVAKYLVKKGFDVVGIDSSVEMLNIACAKADMLLKEQRSRLSLKVGDISNSLNLNEFQNRFHLAFFAYSTFLELSSHEAQSHALKAIYKLIRPGGYVAIDMALFNPYVRGKKGGTLYNPPASRHNNEDNAFREIIQYFPPTSKPCKIEVRFLAKLDSSMNRTFCVTENVFINILNNELRKDVVILDIGENGNLNTDSVLFTLRLLSRKEMKTLLTDAGYRKIKFYGDYSFGKWTPNSNRLIVVARKENT